MRVIITNNMLILGDENVLKHTTADYMTTDLTGYNTAAPNLDDLYKLYEKGLGNKAAANAYKRYKELVLANYEKR
ncbi:hypothetical protein ACIQXV_02800 [Neobacillus sp. NPDC097160]|uniref:hypothetical protein n=1 Tax=Neobacillus sp. NPDC097160 TaxID=3364298 RepID=UPI0037F7552E